MTAGFEFDVPVRFDTDKLEISAAGLPARRHPAHSHRRGAADEGDLPPGLQAHLDSGATTLVLVLAADAPRRHAARLHRSRPRSRFRRHDVRGRRRLHRERDARKPSAWRSTISRSTGALSSAASTRRSRRRACSTMREVEIFRVNWSERSAARADAHRALGEVAQRQVVSPPRCAGLRTICSSRRAGCYQYHVRCRSRRCALRGRSGGAGVYGDSARWHPCRRSALHGDQGSTTYGSDWFTRGLLTFTSGAAAGQTIEVQRHTRDDGGGDDRAVAAACRAAADRRHDVHRHRRLRQAPDDLPGERSPTSRTFRGFPAHARQRLRHRRCATGRS